MKRNKVIVIGGGAAGMLASIAAAVLDWFTKGPDRETVRGECLRNLSGRWNSDAQMEIFRTVLGPYSCVK